MSVQDMIKKSILKSENFTSQNAVKILATLLLAIALGAFIYFVYQRFFTGVVYSRSFAMTLIGMSILTAMVTLAISTNVVISLGMVGALSIVRYRTAVKDPMDLLYLFWAITTGITVGAGMYILAIVTAVVIFAMLLIFSRMQHQGRVFILIIHYQGDETGDRISTKGLRFHKVLDLTKRLDDAVSCFISLVMNNENEDLTLVLHPTKNE